METKFITGKLNSKKYVETIDEQINTNGLKYYIIENCWENLARALYPNSQNIKLKKCLVGEREELS